MAKTIDITSKLTNERPILKIGDREYPIDNRKNTVFQIQAKIDEGGEGMAYIDEVLEFALGKEAAKEINESDITFEAYQIIFIAALAGALGEDFEVAEARFLATQSQA